MTGNIAGFTSTGIDDNATSTAITIDSAGTIYQGCTSPTLHSAVTGIVMTNGSLITDSTRIDGGAITLAQNLAVDSGNTWAYLAAGEGSYYQQFNGNHYFTTAASGSAGADATVNTKMLINSAGNVGIGTSSPTTPLSIRKVHATGYGSGIDMLDFKAYYPPNYDTETSKASIFVGTSDKHTLNTHGGYLAFKVNSSGYNGADGATSLVEYMRIEKDGNVGIGNTNPSGMHANANKLVVGTGSGDQGMSVFAGTSVGRYAFARAVGNNTDAYDGGMSYNGDRDLKFHTNAGATRMTIDGSGNVGIGTDSPAKLGLTGSSAGKVLNLGGDDCQIRLANSILHHDNSGNTTLHLRNHYGATSSSALLKLESGYMTFNTGTSFTERMRLLSNGSLFLTSTGGEPTGSTGGAGFSIDSSNRANFICATTATGNLELIEFRNPNGTVGTIRSNGSGTSYNTSSDYRLKENVVTDWDATTLLKQLKPSKFNFKTDSDTTVQGFLAHEVSSIVPQAVSGEKDGMKEAVLYTAEDELPEGKEIGDIKTASAPYYQSIDHSKLVPLLVKTIDDLKSRIATLEG